MHSTQFKATLSFLFVSITGAKVAKTKTNFLEVLANFFNNDFLYCNYSILFCLGYIALYIKNFSFYYYLFS